MSIEEDLKNKDLWAEGFVKESTGERVEIVLNDDRLDWPIRAIVSDRRYLVLVSSAGTIFNGGRIIRRPVKRKGWVNIYKCSIKNPCIGFEVGHLLASHEECVLHRMKDREFVACVPIEFEEGSGL